MKVHNHRLCMIACIQYGITAPWYINMFGFFFASPCNFHRYQQHLWPYISVQETIKPCLSCFPPDCWVNMFLLSALIALLNFLLYICLILITKILVCINQIRYAIGANWTSITLFGYVAGYSTILQFTSAITVSCNTIIAFKYQWRHLSLFFT